MRSLKSGLFGFAVATILGTVAVIGCSASGDTGDDTTGADPTQPADQDSGSTRAQPGSSTSSSSSSSGGVKDSGADAHDAHADAAKDSGPPAPNPGDACTTPNAIFKRTCGNCGQQEAVCLVQDAGGSTVSPYSDCANEVVGGCTPGVTDTVACGNCGTQTRTCNNYCAYTTTSCQGQPTGSCTPGAVDLENAGCPANQYRQRSCQATCSYDNFGACAAPPTYVLVPPTVGSTNSTVAVLVATKSITTLEGDCPTADLGTGAAGSSPYAYIEVRNTLTKAVTVTVYNSQATGGPIIDTVMATYAGATIPTTDAARKACVAGVGDFGDDTLTGDVSFASIPDVTIPASSSIQVYFAAYDASGTSTGMLKLNVQTNSIAP